jgi:expansin (peptidoglycan-binding protein)
MHVTGRGGGGGGGGGSTGKASYYTAPYVPSACYGYDPNQFPNNQYFAAAGDGNPNIWNNGANCGRNYRIQCQGNGCRGGPITIKVVDRCPNGCSGGRAFDLSEAAFSALANPSVGVISISYSLASSHEGDDEEHQVPLSFN